MDSPLKDPVTFRKALEVAEGWGKSQRGHDIIRAALDEGARASEERERRRRIDQSSLNDSFDL